MMGCQTGMYIETCGATRAEVLEALKSVVKKYFPVYVPGQVPGLTVKECGNPELYDFSGANVWVKVIKKIK